MLGHWGLLSVTRVCGASGRAGAALAHRKPHTVGRDVQLAEQVAAPHSQRPQLGSGGTVDVQKPAQGFLY